MGPVWAIVLAAGSGSRFGGDKLLHRLKGKSRVIDFALDAATAACDGVVLVLPAHWWPGEYEPRADAVVAGGSTRSASVRAGLAAVPGDAEIVVVHDSARPLASVDLFKAVVAALEQEGADGAVPGLPVNDTLKRVDGVRVTGTVPRQDCVAVQTPQAFRAGSLRAAHATGGDATDDAALVEKGGGVVVVVPGEEINIKITHFHDLLTAQLFADPSRFVEEL